jgi:N,N'-diacetyllegionaminate synthase
MSKVFIIAEAGVNHNGDLNTAEKLVDAAVYSGADAVKFQTFTAEKMCAASAPSAEYQIKNSRRVEAQVEMLRRLELDRGMHQHLIDYCKDKKIEFLSSPFDIDSIDLLCSLKVDTFKIPSGEITNLPFLEEVGRRKKKVILSTGMAEMAEIRFAVETIIQSGNKKEDIAILHCTTEYPTPMDSVNLLAIPTLINAFPNHTIGYSDHTLGIEVSIAAAALGAKIIERHLTLDKNMPGPDHKASLTPDQLKGMICAVRNIEKALGSGIKTPRAQELKNREIVRKSIVASKDIKKGEFFSQFNLTIKRPGTGISPLFLYDILGKRAKKDYKTDEIIRL